MRICMYSAIFPPMIGGPATQSFNLCKALVKKGITPVVITYGENFSLDERHGFKVYTFRLRYTHTPLDKALRWFIFPPYILYMLKKERIDILHCHSASALSFLAGFIARILGIPSIIKFAGDWVWETLSTYRLQAKSFDELYKKHLLARIMTRVEVGALNLFNKIWVVSDFRKQNIKDLLGSDNRVIVINNCLMLSGGGPRNWSEGDQVIMITASRYIPHKRLSFMVEVFSKANIPNSKLIIIGGGAKEEEDKVRRTIDDLSMNERVELRGILQLDQIYREFSKASFYISTSIEEGLPNVFIEAMHYGLPILTSDAGGSRELVVDKETGYVVGVYEEDAFIEKIKVLSEDLVLRAQMSRNAFDRSKLYNLENRIGEFIRMYEELLKE